MSIASLIQEGYDLFQGASDIFTTPLGIGGVQPYPTGGALAPALQSVKQKNWQFNLGYSFEVEGNSAFARFNLQINPQDLQQAENFAISITPSQTGVVVEHQGFILKQITIAGTTGLRPSGTVRTGYSEFLLLRNYLRSYVEAKKSRSNRAMRLIFRNKKDNEHWYVEPIPPGLVLRRNASRPFLYDYTLQMAIVGKADIRPKMGGPLGEVLNGIDQVETVIDEVADRIQNVAELIHNGADTLRRTFQDIEITLLNPIDKISTTLQAMQQAKTTVSALPRSFYEDTRRSLTNVRDNFLDVLGLGDAQYDVTYGHQPLVVQKSFIPDDNPTLEGLSKGITVMNKVLSSNILFSQPANAGLLTGTSQNLAEALLLNSASSQAGTTGSNASLSKNFGGDLSFASPTGIKDIVVEGDDTLERIAYREMGSDATQWYQIVLLNNLDPPYLSDVPLFGKKTVKAGDHLMIPTFDSPDRTSVIQKDDSYITHGLTTFEKDLGVDLRLTNDFDLAYDPVASDLHIIAGIPNAAQAVQIKLGLEPDSLLYHPEIGVDAQVGQKMVYTAENIVQMIEMSLLRDVRFEKITSIAVYRASSTISITLHVKLRHLNNPVPLQVNVTS